jgi:uncharacterized protein YndB with AHSA1/START domain
MSNNPLIQTGIMPVVKTLQVPIPVKSAFRLFTEHVHNWWPLDTHSVFGDEAVTCQMEGREGGSFFETHRDGRTSIWGTVLAWEPPSRVIFSMHPGRSPDTAGEVQVTFEALGDATLVTLTHTGWERLGDRGQTMRANYNQGWNQVLAKFVDSVASAG